MPDVRASSRRLAGRWPHLLQWFLPRRRGWPVSNGGHRMPVLKDPVILAQYLSALANWNVSGYIVWKETARSWLLENVEECDERKLNKLLYEHVQAGGMIDQVPERRPEWN